MIKSAKLAASSVNRIPAIPQRSGGHSIPGLHARLINPPEITRGFTEATSNGGCAPSAEAKATSIVSRIILLGLREARKGNAGTWSYWVSLAKPHHRDPPGVSHQT